MPYVNMKELLANAAKEGYAVPAINIVNELSARAAAQTCNEMKAPLILQTSVSTVKQIGPEALIGFLRPIAQRATVPIAVHLDHCTEPELAMRCTDLGWSSIMIDASQKPFEENIRITKAIADYAHDKGATVEGELGAISGVEDHISVSEDDARLASVEGSIRFVEETDVDAFAPAVGTAHGQYKTEPKLDFERFAAIRAAVDAPLVVHGGTGLSEEAFKRFIALGAAKINISTALKFAYCGAINAFVAEHPQNSNPLKLDGCAEEAIRTMCAGIIRLFGACSRA